MLTITRHGIASVQKMGMDLLQNRHTGDEKEWIIYQMRRNDCVMRMMLDSKVDWKDDVRKILHMMLQQRKVAYQILEASH